MSCIGSTFIPPKGRKKVYIFFLQQSQIQTSSHLLQHTSIYTPQTQSNFVTRDENFIRQLVFVALISLTQPSQKAIKTHLALVILATMDCHKPTVYEPLEHSLSYISTCLCLITGASTGVYICIRCTYPMNAFPFFLPFLVFSLRYSQMTSNSLFLASHPY